MDQPMNKLEIPNQGNVGIAYYDEQVTADFPAGDRRMVRSLLRRVSDYGRAAVLWRGDDDPDQTLLRRLVQRKFIMGLLVIGPTPKAFLERMHALKIPTVLVNYPDQVTNFDLCRPDGYKAGKSAARILFERGHRNIDYYHLDTPDADENILNGFYETLLGYSDKSNIQVHTVGADAAPELFKKRLLATPAPTAAYFYNEEPAVSIQRLMHQMKVLPGKDFSLIFNGEFVEDEIRPRRHTTVVYDCDQVAYKSLEMLFERAINPDAPPRRFLADYTYIEGETCKTVPGQPVRPEYANLPDPDPEWEKNERQLILEKARGLQIHYQNSIAFLDGEAFDPGTVEWLSLDAVSFDRKIGRAHV
jgi:DNA-binding LacI/PurR family transcriptional regulator